MGKKDSPSFLSFCYKRRERSRIMKPLQSLLDKENILLSHFILNIFSDQLYKPLHVFEKTTII